jgi:hypothetical protein
MSFLHDYAKSKNRELFKKAVNAFIDDTGNLAKVITSKKGKPGEAILELLMPKLYRTVLEIREFEQEEFQRKVEERNMGIKLKPKKSKASPAPWVDKKATPPTPFDWDNEESK